MLTFADFETVKIPSSFVRATYGPPGQPENDVTDAVRSLAQHGLVVVLGGIHTAIGDPYPGVEKQLCVYFAT